MASIERRYMKDTELRAYSFRIARAMYRSQHFRADV